ncbi:MAG TPA: hypothetical protein RMH99_32275 [Sandaracinaceae bacterium LLY-WYZ-13_1]|nr:hypothetical protein [Sandaracinaceae bacterium LLY-WYZ-13_1]
MRPRVLCACLTLLLAGCDGDDPVDDASTPDAGPVELDAGPRPDRESAVTVALDAVVAEVDPRFLSVAIDSAQLVGGTFWDPSGESTGTTGDHPVPPYDFASPKVRRLASALAPALLRLGGTDADMVYYDLSDDPVEEPPEGYEAVMTRAQWDGVHDFLDATGYDLMFCLNAGPGPRDADGAWDPAQARALMAHAAAEGQGVAVWELGNEPNGFRLIHGIDPDPAGHAAAYETLAALRDELAPDARLAGPASAWWPTSGELGRFYPDFVDAGGLDPVEIVTWHYYPQQSRRCPVRTTPAEPTTMLQPENLAEVEVWAEEVEAAVTDPDDEVWLGETGGAQCGGEPGVSDRFVGSFWWADQLGRMARRGQRVVVRQTLSGGTYGLLDDASLDPRPDYWTSVLWRRTMGTRVLAASTEDPALMAYAHCAAGSREGAVAVVLLNVTLDQGVVVDLPGLGATREVYLADGPLYEPGYVLNGEPLEAAEDGTLPAIAPVLEEDDAPLRLPPTSLAFVVFPDASAVACAP